MNEPLEVRAAPVAHVLNASFVAGAFASAILGHARQPDRVPVHFDLAGVPDRWAHKSWGNTLAVPLMGLAVTAIVYLAAQIVGWARRHPGMLNLPHKEAFLALPPELQAPVWRQLKVMGYWLAVPQTLVFLILALGPGEDGRLRVWPVFAPMALVVVLGLVLTLRLSRGVRDAIAAGARRAPA